MVVPALRIMQEARVILAGIYEELMACLVDAG